MMFASFHHQYASTMYPIDHSHIRTNQHHTWLGEKFIVCAEYMAHSQRKLASASYSTALGIPMFSLDTGTSAVPQDLEYRKAIGRQKFRELRHAEVKRCTRMDCCNVLETPAHLRRRSQFYFLWLSISRPVFSSLPLSPPSLPLSLVIYGQQVCKFCKFQVSPFLRGDEAPTIIEDPAWPVFTLQPFEHQGLNGN